MPVNSARRGDSAPQVRCEASARAQEPEPGGNVLSFLWQKSPDMGPSRSPTPTPKWLANCLMAWVCVTGLVSVLAGALYERTRDIRIAVALLSPLFLIGIALMVGILVVSVAARSHRPVIEVAPRVGTRHDRDIFGRR